MLIIEGWYENSDIGWFIKKLKEANNLHYSEIHTQKVEFNCWDIENIIHSYLGNS